MKINPVAKNQNFLGIYNNKAVLKGLEKISDHGASFVAATALTGSLFLRPLSINLSGANKENKKYASANSISSGLVKFALAEAIALPIEKSVQKIDANPQRYLKKETIGALKAAGSSLGESRKYKFATQILKLGANFISAIPKSVLTLSLIPIIADNIFKEKKDEKNLKPKYDDVFKPVQNSINFSGLKQPAEILGSILDNKQVQNFVNKTYRHDTNIARNISNATDILLTSAFALSVKKSKKIKEDNKNPLIYNNLISTGVCILGGSALDKAVQITSKKSLEQFKKINRLDPKLSKYVEGINILRPTLIFALIYYGVLPFFSTSISEKIDLYQKTNK